MFTIDADFLINALTSVSTLAASNVVTLRSIDSELWLFSKAANGVAAHILPAPKLKDFFVIVETDSLRSAIQGRKEVTLLLKDEVLQIKSGSFKVSLTPVEGLEEGYDIPRLKGTKSKFTGEESAWLADAIKAVSITPSIATFMLPLGLKMTSKGSIVTCYDTFKISYLKSKSITGDGTFILPLATIQSLMSVFGKRSFTLVVSDHNILAYDSNTRFLTALPQEDKENSISFDAVLERTSTKIGENVLTLGSQDLNLFLTSLRSIKSAEATSVKVEANNSKVTFKVQTTKGSIQETLPNKTPCTLSTSFNLLYLEDAIKKCKEELKISIEESVALITTDRAKMLVSLDNV